MPLKVTRLRRWLAVTAVLFTAVVAGTYFYARSRLRNVLKEVPNKIGIGIKQTATGFQFSKSEGGRTLFTIQASDVKQFKLNGRAELHNVSIVLYGRDSSRFDQISGEDFAYDPKSGDVKANGEVQIDLEANPAGLKSVDQAVPRELKNPIHLKTRDLVFNRESGNAFTDAAVEFRMPQASGSAVGMRYVARSNTLTLSSQIHVLLTGPDAAVVDANRAVVTKQPRQIVVEQLRVQRGTDNLRAETATFFLGEDHNVDRVLATGEVHADTVMDGKPARARDSSARQASRLHARADEGELLLADNEPQTATLRGNVLVERSGEQPMLTRAGRMILDFSGPRRLAKIRATDGVHIVQGGGGSGGVLRTADSPGRLSPHGPLPHAASSSQPGQDFDLTAPTVDFLLTGGHTLERAVTIGSAQIVIASSGLSASASSQLAGTQSRVAGSQRTVITAGKFEAKFEMKFDGPPGSASEDRIRLSSIHGAPDAKIVSVNPGEPDRVSTSQSMDATFLAQGGIESITQSGAVTYTDNQAADKRTQAWADRARYTPADQMLLLSGNPRVAAGAMSTTGQTIRINRSTGDAFADGDVKSTYNQLKELPDGALLASSSPIHVTARSMTAHGKPGGALYSGNARLWQDANVIQAPTIAFDREHRSVTAQGTAAQPVSTVLIPPAGNPAGQVGASAGNKGSDPAENKVAEAAPAGQKTAGKKPKSSPRGPISVTGMKFTYTDEERKAHYEGGVVAKGSEFTASANSVDAYLLPHTQGSGTQSVAAQGQLDRLVAAGNVVIQQPGRRAEGQQLVYTAVEDKFVITGGPPSIFDAERGKITGVSLTFYRRDDRVLVEGEASTPVVTQTRLPR